MIDEVRLGLKWVCKLEDVVQNISSCNSRRTISEVFRGTEGGDLQQMFGLVVKSIVGKQNLKSEAVEKHAALVRKQTAS